MAGNRIRALRIGDIFHATSDAGRTLVCLVIDRDATHLQCRRLTTDEHFVFDRTKGIATDDGEVSVIDSVEPLPPDIRDVMLALYVRFRDMPRGGDATLSRAEKDALLFLHDFYLAHPL